MTGPMKASPIARTGFQDSAKTSIAYQPFILLAELTSTPASINLVTATKSPTQAASRKDSSIVAPTIRN